MSDAALQKEAEYLYLQCQRAIDAIRHVLQLMQCGVRNITVPAWKLQEDLNIHSERYAAVIEEIDFRNIP